MEQRHGLGVSMGDIAKAAGISRQAVYLHFASRTELMIATTNYVDEVKGLNERLNRFKAATTGTHAERRNAVRRSSEGTLTLLVGKHGDRLDAVEVDLADISRSGVGFALGFPSHCAGPRHEPA